MFRKWRPDLEVHFADVIGPGAMYDYLYHCNMQQPTYVYYTLPKSLTLCYGFNFCRGEEAFRALQGATIWARNPMLKRIGDLSKHVPMTLIYGSRTWVDITQGSAVKQKRCHSYCDCQVIEGGGHHVYFDKPEEFNDSVEKICQAVDEETNSTSL